MIRQFSSQSSMFKKCNSILLNCRKPFRESIINRSASSIPVVQSCPVDGSKSADEVRRIENALYQQHRSNPTGLIKCERGNYKFLVPATKNTLKEFFQLAARGQVNTEWYPSFHHLIGHNSALLLSSYDARHKNYRKKLNPMFMDEPLADRFDVVQLFAHNFYNSLCSDKYLQIRPIACKFAFDVVMGVIFGTDVFTEEKSNKMLKDFKVYSEGFSDHNIDHLDKPETLLGRAMIHRQNLSIYIQQLVTNCMDLYENNELDPKSIIYKMIDNKVFETNEQYGDNVLNLIFAGYDTTASSICNVLYCLDQFRDNSFVIELRKELRANTIDFDFLMNNKLLDAFAKEVLRFIPTVGQYPKSMREDADFGGCPIKTGTVVMIYNYFTARIEEVFGKNADSFDPMRFVENPPSKQVWYPFGLGTKICLGWKLAYLEIKMITSLVMTNDDYVIQLDKNRLQKAQDSALNFYDVYGRAIKVESGNNNVKFSD